MGGEWVRERLLRIATELIAARRARGEAWRAVTGAIGSVMPEALGVAHGSVPMGLDHPSSDVDIALCPGEDEKGAVAEWSRAAQALDELVPSRGCDVCGSGVVQRRLRDLGGVQTCAPCSALECVIDKVIAYSTRLQWFRQTGRARNRPYELIASSLRSVSVIRSVEYIRHTRVPVVVAEVECRGAGSAVGSEGLQRNGSRRLIRTEVSLAHDAARVAARNQKVLRLASAHERAFLRPLTLLVKDILYRSHLDSTYAGGVGGYMALCMVYYYLRHTNALGRGGRTPSQDAASVPAADPESIEAMLVGFLTFYVGDEIDWRECALDSRGIFRRRHGDAAIRPFELWDPEDERGNDLGAQVYNFDHIQACFRAAIHEIHRPPHGGDRRGTKRGLPPPKSLRPDALPKHDAPPKM